MSSFEVAKTTGPRGTSPAFFFCDHATNIIPDGFAGLGLSDNQLDDHIAYDPGSADLAAALAEALSARILFCGYSRLVIDPNRGEERADLIMKTSDTISVPGNQNLSADERHHRLAQYYHPYHCKLSDELDCLTQAQSNPFVISMHSFCRALRGEREERPWEAGLLWRDDRASAMTVMEHLSANGVKVGDNQPYSAKLYNYSVNRHVGSRGLRHITLEIRQDLLNSTQAINRWRDLLFEPLRALIEA
ncbi:MAG: N-formylglutamate amidohydrolase [Robiginitomaculum sp.]|nr:MAG: N-formylglutamate amidohydrolase [Robiginitomaculum sp.]